jgi:KaiC/GvpD/RAD55 family RecA-like ATPase
MKKAERRVSIPHEIVEFFEKEGGHSLLVEGGAGTGKTTFVLQTLEELAEPDLSFYLTTRVSDQALYNQFPWLKEKEMRTRIIDSSRVLLDVLYKKEEKREVLKAPAEIKKIKRAREFLEAIKKKEGEVPEHVDRTRLNLLLERTELPEIERVYERIDRLLPAKTMLVIDSVEGLTHRYRLEHEDFITTLQKDLVENSNVNLLLVLERLGASHLEYIVDGVVSFSKIEHEKRRIREINLSKLRATEIRQPSYLVTLLDGRFLSFEPYAPDFSKPKIWEPIPDTEEFYSTGIPDLDTLLGGGFRKGSYNVIEIAENVSGEDYYSIVRPILLNFISQERGLFAVLSGGDHAETLKADLVHFIDPAIFDKYVRIVDHFVLSSDKPYIMALGGKDKKEAMRIYQENIIALRGAENKPIIDYNGLDTVEYLMGGDVAIKDLLGAVAKTKISTDLGIGILKPGLKLTQEIMNMADTYIKIIDVDKCPCLYGIKPKTCIFAIVPDDKKGWPHVNLVPVV